MCDESGGKKKKKIDEKKKLRESKVNLFEVLHGKMCLVSVSG